MNAALDMSSRLAHTEQVWDTAVTIDLLAHEPQASERLEPALGAIVHWVHRVDDMLSTFRPESDLSHWRAGRLDLRELSPEVGEVLELATAARERTAGAFDPGWQGGASDPTGLVKGWAVDRAVVLAGELGVHDLQINAGGDVRTRGRRLDGGPWRVGIEDPEDGERLLDVISGNDLCVATSSPRHRGDHIRRAGRPVRELLSATVVGPDLAACDAYSTAAFAAGTEAPDLLCSLEPDGFEALLLFADRRPWTTRAWPGELQGDRS